MLESVKNDGQTLYFASERLRDDKDVVSAAVSNKGIILKYASFRLRDDEEVAQLAISQNKEAVYFLSENLKQKFNS